MNTRKKASVTAWFSLVIGILCFVLSVCFVIALFLPGGEYGAHADFFNFFFWGFLFVGPVTGTASTVLGLIGLCKIDKTDNRSKINNAFSLIGLISGAITVVVFILFLAFMGAMTTCVMLHV
ncbi:MAG: hypothetical protein IJI34_11465 [Clostridia bacterium]|nr:hypothetical protein [Clostridia bacterium]